MAISPYQVKPTYEQDKITKNLEQLKNAINAGSSTNIDATANAFITQQRLAKDAELDATNARRASQGMEALSYDQYYGMARPDAAAKPTVGIGQAQIIETPKTEVGGTAQQNQETNQNTTNLNSNASISDIYGQQTNLLVNQLKQKIAEAKAGQQAIISKAPQQFDPLRGQSELAKGQQLRSVLERNSLMGDRGGVGRQAALQTQTAGENRLNSINLQQQQVIDTANQEIANLESQGLYEEANIRAQQKLAELQALMSESQRQDEIARQNELLNYNRTQDADAQARNDFNTTIQANYGDITGFVQQLVDSGAPQWQIDAANAARVQKAIDIGINPNTGERIPVDTTPQLTSSSAAIDLWKQLGTANQAIANALGVPVSTRYQGTATGGSGASSGIGGTTTQFDTFTPKQAISYAESNLRGTSGVSSADLMVQLNDAGLFDNLTPSEITSLMKKFDVDALMLEQAENRATIPSQGITLPSGRNINQNGITPTTGGFTGALNMIR